MFVPRAVREVGEVFLEEGFRPFLVGGAVRDYFLGRYVRDYDIVVDVPDYETLLDVLSLGGNWLVFPLSPSWGVVRVMSGTFMVDVSLMRAGLKDGVPVFGSNLLRDLIHRDFTINAIAYDLASRDFIDFVGGRVDIRRRVIRTPLSPRVSLGMDPARVLRAVGLSLRLGFKLDQDLVVFLKSSQVEKVISPKWEPRLSFEFQKWEKELGPRFVWVLEDLGLLDKLKFLNRGW